MSRVGQTKRKRKENGCKQRPERDKRTSVTRGTSPTSTATERSVADAARNEDGGRRPQHGQRRAEPTELNDFSIHSAL